MLLMMVECLWATDLPLSKFLMWHVQHTGCDQAVWPELSMRAPTQGNSTRNAAKSPAATILSLCHEAPLGWRVSAAHKSKRVQTSYKDLGCVVST